MSKQVFARKQSSHEVAADQILQKHEMKTKTTVTLPVPVELIIEQTMELNILWDEIDEPAGSMILGALSPSKRLITLNTKHQSLFESVLGPERFTLAHELGHWLYDADQCIGQQQLALATPPAADEFCYHREGSSGLPESVGIREINANKFASCLLMPKHLVKAANVDEVVDDFRATARRWGVSQQALRIRLETLGLLDTRDIAQLNFSQG